MVRCQKVLSRRECQKIIKKGNLQKKNNNTFECHDLEIYVVDNDARVVTGECHWLINRLTAFVDDIQATSQIGPISIAVR